MAKRALVDRFLIENVSIYGEDPHHDLEPRYIGLTRCLEKLPDAIVERLCDLVLVHIPRGRPACVSINEPVSLIFLPESMQSWPWDAIEGAIAHEFAHAMDGLETCWTEQDCDDWAVEWGFAAEVQAAQDVVADLFFKELGLSL